MTPVLTEKEVRQRLSALPGWSYLNNSIERQFEFQDFKTAMKFVNRVAEAAEKANHHPDIDIRYNKVKMSLTSHDSGGVTARDLQLAQKIAEIASA
jgi:4a-hydroxytetrahydrobiopterin dehydratase